MVEEVGRPLVDTVITALTSVEFGAGFRLGLIAAVLGGLGAVSWRANTGKPGRVVGALFTGAAALSMNVAMEVPAEVWLGLAVLGIGGLLSRSKSLTIGVMAAIPGAWLIAGSLEIGSASWTSWFLLAALIGGAALAGRTDDELSVPILGPLLLALTIGGVYLAVPDTEEMLVLAGAITPLALLGWPSNVSKIGSSGSYMAVGILVWAAWWGGMGRPAAIVGAVSCLGMLLLVPLCRRSRDHPALVVGLHLILVAAGSRLAAQQSDPNLAALLAGVAVGGAYIAIRLVTRQARRTQTNGEGQP
jgi:hypothetical protein